MLLLSLLLSTALLALTFALPDNKSPVKIAHSRDDSWSHGILANGVFCATLNEPVHTLESSDITSAMINGGSNVYVAQTSPYGAQNIFWPKQWNSSLFSPCRL